MSSLKSLTKNKIVQKFNLESRVNLYSLTYLKPNLEIFLETN